ncbi:hypothetical protein KBAHV46_44560 [Aeromonas hydrophila]|nr:hypothetical protein KBAHV27_44500 [Aeromonas hydrophila]CAD7559690.1 hypothetical protein KBAHV42_44600 [Aeromonas hydrophila]CAD7559699.1 hypothetical protein KBAHV46_44560 [Aeromonas hydrophila]CAD7560238.1 hypothetical protein KBAHV22_44660 [Aeromonas hydrophila]
MVQITSDIELSGAGCTTAITPNQLVQSSSENDKCTKVEELFKTDLRVTSMFIRAYLRASTADQDAERAKEQLVRIPAKLNSHSGQREHPDP